MTPKRADTYDPIEDWTPDGRRLLVAARGDEIRALLDLAFSDFVDDSRVGLSAFGFRGDDPVTAAVEWSIKRFLSSDLDSAALHPGSRGFRLFTEVRFWLSQKVGSRGYRRILSYRFSPGDGEQVPEGDGAGDDEDVGATDAAVLAFARELAATLRVLGSRTCAEMIGFWLEGTKVLRREWFGWRDRGGLSEVGSRLPKKQRSFYSHDAMFRFLCLFRDLVPAEPDDPAERALVLTTLSPCESSPPYRVSDREIVPHLFTVGVRVPRDVGRLRKKGASACLRRCLQRAACSQQADGSGRITAELTRLSVGPTTLHALGIEHEKDLRDAVGSLCTLGQETS